MLVTEAFTGGLVGSSVVQMLSVGTPIEGSAGYVAVERDRPGLTHRPSTEPRKQGRRRRC